jgi:hypothetical protein
LKGKSAALVDIVASDGMEWVRVSTSSEKRLLFDLAKLGWQNDSDDEDEDMMDTDTNWEDDDDDDQVDLVKNARELARAARANPIRGRPPRVRFILTRVASGRMREIDSVINKMKATGATVLCANDVFPSPPLVDVLPNLLVDRSRSLSDTLNIDCTILLALISDISHRQCPILDWYPREVRAQIEEENTEKLLPTHLYPAIGSHAMVCTQEAAEQMKLIVETLATDTEKEEIFYWHNLTKRVVPLTRSCKPGPHYRIILSRMVYNCQSVSAQATSPPFILAFQRSPRR